ncbi:hypothetical protein ANTHELSMS3_00252 [Antarctobacter heliothermus]|uniref:Uncharacterized protein n=1 Tax=Antarctobacter heliothermus TaxID=74033 RepID=A0A222DYE3_9RHOB|nr:hypothetical protein [Antarctobacter heliothermus]ASP18977.1 hypothetical protein ANTHELSMS3_00252 [Antarctobacter heliothermus]
MSGPLVKPSHADSPCTMSILTIVALSALCFSTLTIALWVSGIDLKWALLLGWLGGGAATCALTILLTAVLSLFAPRND